MNQKSFLSLVVFLLISAAVFSQEKKNSILYVNSGLFSFPYHINHPDHRWELPKKLEEISGLSYISQQKLACVQDEKGKIYIFNTKKGEVEKQIEFNDHGDYEGIEIIGNNAWILKSKGTLYEIKDFLQNKTPKVYKYQTALSEKNNAEGLGYNTLGNKLLIACKGYPFVNEEKLKKPACFKAVYSFDLKTKQLNKNPVMLITLDSIKQHKDYNTLTRAGITLLAYLDASEGDVSFKPSGIAMEPKTGNYYVLASSGKALAVFSSRGIMLALVALKSTIHAQPEGICFSPDGTLYISNEGSGGKGIIYQFNRKN